jgi:hypothetical protein
MIRFSFLAQGNERVMLLFLGTVIALRFQYVGVSVLLALELTNLADAPLPIVRESSPRDNP